MKSEEQKTEEKKTNAKQILIEYINSKSNVIDEKTRRTKKDLLDEVERIKIQEFTNQFLDKLRNLKKEIQKDKELSDSYKSKDGMRELIKKYDDMK